MADLPIDLPADLAAQLEAALDVEGKIARALEALGPVAGRDVAFVDTPSGCVVDAVRRLGARTTDLPLDPLGWAGRAAQSVDVIAGLWSAFRGINPIELEAADRLLRPDGRLLVVHEYGRDDVSRLRGERPEYGAWSQRNGPFLASGFKLHVIHCFWTFPDLEATQAFLDSAFGAPGQRLGESLKRPRLSWNVAVYHRRRLLPSAAP